MVPTGQVAEKQACKEPRQDDELQSWRCLVVYLCFFGFMAQLRPGESFITPYLLGPDHNFTAEQASCHRRVGEWRCGLGFFPGLIYGLPPRLCEATGARETGLVGGLAPP